MIRPKREPFKSHTLVLKASLTNIMQKLVGEKTFDLDIKTPKNASKICLNILQTFEECDTQNSGLSTIKDKNGSDKSQSLGLSKKFSFNGKENRETSIKTANRNFVYFILNVTNQEFHKSFRNFFERFDRNHNFYIEKSEFNDMLQFLCKKENIGKNKLTRCFSKVATAAYARSKHLDGVLSLSSDHELGPNLIEEIFSLLKDQSMETQELCIDYIKLLPIGLAFFSEDIKSKIEAREEIFQKVSGINSRGEKLNRNNKSLLSKFESLGIEYKEYNSKPLNLRDIEKALSIFRNSCPTDYDFNQIDIVLKEIQKKYQYDTLLGTFRKPPKLNKKFLTYLTHTVCMNFLCQNIAKTKAPDCQSLIIKEYTLWNALTKGRVKLDSEYISHGFSKYAKKHLLQKNSPSSQIRTLAAGYIKKILPGIQKRSIDNIINTFMDDEPTPDTIIDDFAEQLYEIIMKEAENKILEYITSNYEKFEPGYKSKSLGQSKSSQSNIYEQEKENGPIINSNTKMIAPMEEEIAPEEKLALNENNISLNQDPHFDRSMNESKNEEALKLRSLSANQVEKAEKIFPQSISSINGYPKESFVGSLSKVDYLGSLDNKPGYARAIMKENLPQKPIKNERREKELLNSYFIMGVVLERHSQQANKFKETNTYGTKSLIEIKEQEKSQLLTHGINDYSDHSRISKISRLTVEREDNSKLKPVKVDDVVEDFNQSEKLIFTRKGKRGNKAKKREERVCGIQCNVM